MSDFQNKKKYLNNNKLPPDFDPLAPPGTYSKKILYPNFFTRWELNYKSLSNRRLSRDRWFIAFGTVALIVCSIILTPVALRDIEETKALDMYGLKTQGKIISRHENTWKNRCGSSVDLEYEIQDKKYYVVMKGCGVVEERLPLTALVDVTYLSKEPSVSRASTTNGITPRFNWLKLFGLWLLTISMSFVSILSFIYRRT